MISLTLICFLAAVAMVGMVGTIVYRTLQAKVQAQASNAEREREESNADSSDANQNAVEHGGVATPEELHGHGKLYFVPVGRQVIPVQSLADYYQQKFGITVTVLPGIKVGPSTYVPERHQCEAQELMNDMVNAYPEIARNPVSVMIALTDEDIFPLTWDGDSLTACTQIV